MRWLPRRSFVAAVDAELADDLRDVELRAVEGDAEALGDLLVGEALADEREHLPLSRCEGVRVPRPPARLHRARSLSMWRAIYPTRYLRFSFDMKTPS